MDNPTPQRTRLERALDLVMEEATAVLGSDPEHEPHTINSVERLLEIGRSLRSAINSASRYRLVADEAAQARGAAAHVCGVEDVEGDIADPMEDRPRRMMRIGGRLMNPMAIPVDGLGNWGPELITTALGFLTRQEARHDQDQRVAELSELQHLGTLLQLPTLSDPHREQLQQRFDALMNQRKPEEIHDSLPAADPHVVPADDVR